jgi:phage terminase large subunit
MRDWLKDRGSFLPNAELEFDLQGPEYSYDSKNRIQLEKKEDMKKRGISSPDLGDALALTFAERLTPTMGASVSAADYSNHNAHEDLDDPLGGF